MLFQRKVDRAMKWAKGGFEEASAYKNPENTGETGGAQDDFDEEAFERYRKQVEPEFEKNDIKAIILSAIMVFGPVFIVLALICALMVNLMR